MSFLHLFRVSLTHLVYFVYFSTRFLMNETTRQISFKFLFVLIIYQDIQSYLKRGPWPFITDLLRTPSEYLRDIQDIKLDPSSIFRQMYIFISISTCKLCTRKMIYIQYGIISSFWVNPMFTLSQNHVMNILIPETSEPIY